MLLFSCFDALLRVNNVYENYQNIEQGFVNFNYPLRGLCETAEKIMAKMFI